MANSSRITRSQAPRALQYGLDKIIDQNGKDYKGMADRIYQEIMTDKGFYEAMQLAGVGMAQRKGEGDSITWDSVDQSWVYRIPVYTYEKSVRITREMIKDNVYENMLPRIAREQLKGLSHARDLQGANVLNRHQTSGYTYGDGSVLSSTSHALQSGGTSSNRLAVDSDLSEDSLESAVQLIDAFLNDDGLKSDYVARRLIVPTALRFEAKRILNNPSRPATADRDINVLYADGEISEICVWKRLTDSDAWYVQTNADNGLVCIRREGIYTDSSQDFETYDSKVTAAERYAYSVLDWRCIVSTPGA